MVARQVAFFEHQRRAYYATQQYKITAMTCGTGAGKTWGGADMIIMKALSLPKLPYEQLLYAVAPTFPMWDRTIRIQLNRALFQLGLKEGVHYKANITKRTITFLHNNVTIYGVAANVPESMQGGHVAYIWCDECGIYSNESWFVIKQRAAQKKAPILLTSTPYRWNWYRDLVVEAQQAQDNGLKTNVYAFSVPSIANPYFPEEEFYEAQKTWPDWRFEMYFLGEFSRPMGIIYPNGLNSFVDDFPIPNGWPIYAGLDFGSVHPTAIVWIAEDPATGTMYVFDEYKESGIDLMMLSEVMRRHGRKRFYADPSGKFNIDGLNSPALNHDVHKAANDVLPGIDAVYTAFAQGKLKIFASCHKLRKEITQYAWQLDKNDQPIEKPIKIFDDLMDALRYPIYTRVGEPKLAPPKHVGDDRRRDFHRGIERMI